MDFMEDSVVEGFYYKLQATVLEAQRSIGCAAAVALMPPQPRSTNRSRSNLPAGSDKV